MIGKISFIPWIRFYKHDSIKNNFLKKFTKAVKLAFCRLYEMGIIMRETRLVQVVGENEPVLKEQWFLHLDEMNNDLLGHLDSEKVLNRGK